MRRPLAELANRDFDVAVVGAGINGTSAAQQLASQGYTVLLVDKGDIGSGSSSRSTRLLHVGLRYLAAGTSMWQQLMHPAKLAVSLRMAQQSALARNAFATTSGERTRNFKFGFPIYRDGMYRPWQIDLAFFVLKRLIGSPVPPVEYHRMSQAEARANPLYKNLRDLDKLDGVAVFREYQFDWPERVSVDMALDAERMGAAVRNYTPVTKMARTQDGRWALTLADARDPAAAPVTVNAKSILNMAGIWIDKVNNLSDAKVGRRIFGTKGAHIAVRLPPECAGFGVTTVNRLGLEPVYIVPWRHGLHYVGVTETVYDGNIDDIHATEEDVQWLLEEANHAAPGLALKRSDVLYSWAGVRPLTYDPAFPKGARSRLAHDFGAEGMPNVFAMTAGPVTSHRSAGIEMAERVQKAIKPSGKPQTLDYTPRRFPDSPASPALMNSYPDIKLSHLRHAAEHEKPETLVDLLFRRVGAGWTDTQGREAARKAAETVADIMGWDEARIQKEADAYVAHLKHTHPRPDEL